MYPNQSPFGQQPPQQQLPTDYLNQISPDAPKKSMFSFGLKQVIIIGVALVVLMLILVGVVNAFAGGKKTPLERLSARLAATEIVATDAQKNLKSSQLRSLNSNLKLYMTNTNRDVAAPLLAVGVNTAKLSDSSVKAEDTTELTSRLEDARLNGVYDRTYAREMTYQLGTLLTLMTEIYNSTGNEGLKSFLKTAYDSLKPTQESFANFSTTD